MARDDEFGIIYIENLWEDSYKSPGVLNVWLLIYEYLNIIQSIMWLQSKEAGCFLVASWNKFIIAKWRIF